MFKRLELWGGLVTVTYFAFLWSLIGGKLINIKAMELNNLGDFLAGVFGPVAFLWLILGFLQQGRELRLSTDALRLQAEELKNSVEQQTEMTRIQAVGLANQVRLLQPLFEIKYLGSYHHHGDYFERFEIANTGGYCDCLTVVLTVDGVESYPIELEPMNAGTVRVFSLDIYEGDGEISVSYRSIDDARSSRVFNLIKWYGEDDGEEGITARQRPPA